MRKLLAPKLKPKEPQIEDFIVVDQGHDDDEVGDSLAINPVVQMRFLMDRETGGQRRGGARKGAHAYGALRKLKLNLAHGNDGKERKEQGLHHVDRALDLETKRAQAAIHQAEALVRKAEATKAEDARVVREAEEAAKEAKRLRGDRR